MGNESNKPKQLRGYKPPSQSKACPISRRQLAKMVHFDKFSNRSIHTNFHIADATLQKWYNLYDISPKKFVDYTTIQDATMILENGKVLVVWTEAVDEAKTEPNDESNPNAIAIPFSEAAPQVRGSTVGEAYELTANERAWLSLTEKARETIRLMASFGDDIAGFTDKEIAAKVGIAYDTMKRYRADEAWSACLMDAKDAAFKPKAREIWMDDMIARYHGAKALAKEDRQLLARVLGLDKQGLSVNVGVSIRGVTGVKDDW